MGVNTTTFNGKTLENWTPLLSEVSPSKDDDDDNDNDDNANGDDDFGVWGSRFTVKPNTI